MFRLTISLAVLMIFLNERILPQQILECFTQIPSGVTVQQAASGNLSLYKRTTNTPPIRLAVHIVRYSNGSGGIHPDSLDFKITKLNYYMSQAMFSFYKFSEDYIDSDYFANIDTYEKANQLRTINYKPGCINVYFVPLSNWYGLSSFSPRIQDPNLFAEDGIVVRNDAHKTTLPHEVGHYFDLFHTYETYFGYENIAREGSCANCLYSGDLLCDTPADPSGKVTFSTINYDCQWDPIRPLPPDSCGQTNYAPLTNNLMITEVKHCRNSFTQDQKDRMNQTLLEYRPELLKPLLVYMENNALNFNAGGTLFVGNKIINSGGYAFVDNGQYSVGTNNERFINFMQTGSDFKHNNWNGNFSDFLLKRNLLINNHSQQIAKFDSLNVVLLRNSWELFNFNDTKPIWFNDPWYVKDQYNNQSGMGDFLSFSSPYSPTGAYNQSTGGVFLNQGYNPVNQTWNPPYYSVKAEEVQDIQLSQTGRTHKFYFQGWSANPQGSAEFQDASALQTPVVFKQENATVQANFKGTQLSSSTDGFRNPGQRKLVITSYPQAYYHLVYSSMGSVWYEKAQLNYDVVSPVNWQLMNNHKALNSHLPNFEAKSPSIDYVYATRLVNEENYFIYIVYQSKNNNGKYTIRLSKFNKNGDKIFDTIVYESLLINYNSIDCTPVVGVSKQPMADDPIKLVVLWKRPTEGSATAGLYYTAGFDRGSYIEWTDSYPNPVKIPSTDINSSNPSLAVYKSPNENISFHLAYQQGSSQIKYSYITFGVNGSTPQVPVIISSGSGSYVNIAPSITVSNSSVNNSSNYDSPKIVWCNGQDGNVFYRYRPNMNTTKWSPIYMYIENDDVQNPVISGPKYDSRGIDNEFYFGWSWLSGYYKSYVSTSNLSQKLSMTYKGKDLQMATVGEGWEGFGYVVLDNFTRSTPPIVFENKWIDGQLSKVYSNISNGRSGTVIKNDAEFYFAFGDLKLNDNTIEFNLLNDTITIETIDDLNNFLQSQSITVNDNDVLTYSVFYGLNDSVSAFNNLSNSDSIKFSVEIVDANTQQLLNVIDEVVQIKNSLSNYENLSYQLSMQGIGQRELIMRLRVENNFNSEYSLANIFSFSQAFNKNRIKQIKWNEENLPDHFSLEQNYPNPFNPTTVLSWQSPAGSWQTLKIYDILGNEVATLVDEYREAGKYKVEFDASNLASGVYIYKLTAGSFNSSRKMMVIK